MSVFIVAQSAIELIAVVLLIWGFINEDKFIVFEDKLARAIAIHIKNRQRRKAAEHRRALQAQKQCHTPQTVFVQAPVMLPPQPVKQQARASGYWVA
jgi:hypothetical protein